jgi:selenocysteine lyase/cysteine desulfurase
MAGRVTRRDQPERKWLMGDFGLGFLFVKESLLERMAACPQYGYFEAQALTSHLLPGDAPGDTPYTWQLKTDAGGRFEVSTPAIGVMMALGQSLPYNIRVLGVEKIQAYRQPMIKANASARIRANHAARLSFGPALLWSKGEKLPVHSRAFARTEATCTGCSHYLRTSPSVFNDMGDIDKLLEALA